MLFPTILALLCVYINTVQAYYGQTPMRPAYGQSKMGQMYGQNPTTSMPGAMPGAMPGGIPGRMPGGIPGRMPGGMAGMMPGFPGTRRRSRNSFKRSPSFLGAKAIGCHYGLDAESLLGMMLPRGCTQEMDYCPYKYPGMQCRRVGSVGMCCPFYVTSQAISQSAGFAQMSLVMEMMS